MTSLYRRANPRQRLLLRMIEGACRNAAHAHPNQPLDDRLARGIAKRAAGTITAQWRDVLARPLVWSEDGAENLMNRPVNRREHWQTRVRSAPPDATRRAPFLLIQKAIGAAVGEARRNGQTERAKALIEVLRLMAREIETPSPPRTNLSLIKSKIETKSIT